MIKSLLFILGIVSVLATGCVGAPHTWGYAHVASPIATSSYIRAVLAAELGDDETAIKYYNLALSHENSPKVRAEREAAIKRSEENSSD